MAIIALLAAILFPVFGIVREKARQASCASNEKQIGLGFLQYNQDNDEQFPVDHNAGYALGWAGAIYPYVRSTQMFACPNDTYVTTVNPSTSVTFSYAMNFNMMRTVSPDTANPCTSVPSLTNPSLSVLVFEVGQIDDCSPATPGEHTSPTGIGSLDFDLVKDTYGSRPASIGNTGAYATGFIAQNTIVGIATSDGTRHYGGSNFLAADGHVKFLGPNSVSGGFTAATTTSVSTEFLPHMAAGTASMKLWNGSPVQLTYSPL